MSCRYYRQLYSKVEPGMKPGFRGRRQAARCLRKEYRMMSDDERLRFHSAVNGLKTNTVSAATDCWLCTVVGMTVRKA